MPFYSSICPICNTKHEYFCKIDDRDNTPECCNQQTTRKLESPMMPVMGLADHYAIKAGNGRTYYGRNDYEKYLKANDLLPSSDLKGEAEHQKKHIAAETRKQTDNTLRETIQRHY